MSDFDFDEFNACVSPDICKVDDAADITDSVVATEVTKATPKKANPRKVARKVSYNWMERTRNNFAAHFVGRTAPPEYKLPKIDEWREVAAELRNSIYSI